MAFFLFCLRTRLVLLLMDIETSNFQLLKLFLFRSKNLIIFTEEKALINSSLFQLNQNGNMNNLDLINKFYSSFANGDAEGMVSCYDDNIQFEDPAFGKLKGEMAGNMWRMLINNNRGITKITYSDVQADDKSGSVNWIAEYVFSQTGRPVINKIAATFEFKDGKIIKHTDVFDMWKWSSQALGLKGYLLGWTGFLKGKIQIQTNSLLKKYIEKQKR